jgi:hypothetical protein
VESTIGEQSLIGAVAGTTGTPLMRLQHDSCSIAFLRAGSTRSSPRDITEVFLGAEDSKGRKVAVQTFSAHLGYGAACGMLLTLSGMHECNPVLRGPGTGSSHRALQNTGDSWRAVSGSARN